MHYVTLSMTRIQNRLEHYAGYKTRYQFDLEGVDVGALSLSFGFILTPSSFGFDLLGFEAADDESGGEVKEGEPNLRRDGCGLSSRAGGAAFIFEARDALEFACDCGSTGAVWGLGGNEGWRGTTFDGEFLELSSCRSFASILAIFAAVL
jgi:hypothetical protein